MERKGEAPIKRKLNSIGLTKRILIFLLVVGVSLCFFPRVSAQAKSDSVEIWVGYFGETYIHLTNVSESEMEGLECGEWIYSAIDNGAYLCYNLAYGVTMTSLMDYVGISTGDINIIYFTGTDEYSGEKGNHGLYNLFGVNHWYYPYLWEFWDQANKQVTNVSAVESNRVEVPAILAFQQSHKRDDTGAFDYDKYKAMMNDDKALRIVFGQITPSDVTASDSVYWVYRITVTLDGSPIKTSNWEAKIGSSQAIEDFVQVDSGYAALDELIKSGLQVTSDNPGVVRVDANGNLIAVGEGTARISVEYVDDSADNPGAFTGQIVASISGEGGSGDTTEEEELTPGGPNGDEDGLPSGGGEDESNDHELVPPETPDNDQVDDQGQDDEEDLNPDEDTGNGEGGSSGIGGEGTGSNGDNGDGNSGNETESTGPSSGDLNDGNDDSKGGDVTTNPNPGDGNDSGTGGNPGSGEDSGTGDSSGTGDNSDEGNNPNGGNGSDEGDSSDGGGGSDEDSSSDEGGNSDEGGSSAEGGNAKEDNSGSADTTEDSAQEAARIQDAIEAGEENVPLSEEGEAVYEQVRDYMEEQIEDIEEAPSSTRITSFTEDVREYIEELIEQAEEQDEPVDMEEIIEMVEEYIDEMVAEVEEEEAAAEELSTEEMSAEAESEKDKTSNGVYLSVGNINGGDSGGGRSGGVESSSDNMATGNTSGGSGGKVLEVEPLPIYYTVLLTVAIAAMFVGGGLYRSLRFRRETAER